MDRMYDIPQIGRLHIELSSRCNASCPACSRNLAGGPVAPELELTELYLDDIKAMFPEEILKNVIGINFCGNLGDAGTARDLLPILEYFKQSTKQKHYAFQVRTNGGMRSPRHWAELGKFFASMPEPKDRHVFSMSGVVFSVDGLEDTNHIYRRGVKWEKLYANMKAYSENGGHGRGIWEWLIFEHNQHQVEEARKLADELGFVFLVKNPMGFGEYDGVMKGLSVYDKEGNFEYSIWPANYDGPKVNPDVGHKVDFTYRHSSIPALTDFSKDLAKRSDINCKSIERGYQEIYVSATGHLLPCCFLGGIFGQFTTSYSRWQFNQKMQGVGLDKFDLRQNSMIDILTGPYFGKFFLDGWKADTVENGKLLYCVETCGEISAIDKLYTRSGKIIPIKT